MLSSNRLRAAITVSTVVGCQCLVGCQNKRAATTESARWISTVVGIPGAIRFERSGQPDDAAATPSGELTLEDAVQRSLRHDPQIQVALSQVRVAEAAVTQASLLPNPILSVSFRYTNIHDAPIADVGLAEDLVAIVERPRRQAAAEARLRVASAEALAAALDVVSEVQQRYASVQALERSLEALAEQQALNGRLLDLARLRLKAGEATELDVITLDTGRLDLELEMTQQRTDLRSERLVLARLIGRPSSEPDWKLTTGVYGNRIAGAEREWVSAALRRRPEVRAAAWELKALGDDAAVARLAVLEGGDVGVTSERDVHWSAGPALTTPVPIFDWGQAKQDKAGAERVAARHKLTMARRQVIEEVRSAYAAALALQAAADRVRDELIPLQFRRHQQAETAYRAGETELATLLLAEEDLEAANVKRFDLERKAALALFKFQRAVGGPAVAIPSSTAPATTPVAGTPVPSTRAD